VVHVCVSVVLSEAGLLRAQEQCGVCVCVGVVLSEADLLRAQVQCGVCVLLCPGRRHAEGLCAGLRLCAVVPREAAC
jgi:hypothetical protein